MKWLSRPIDFNPFTFINTKFDSAGKTLKTLDCPIISWKYPNIEKYCQMISALYPGNDSKNKPRSMLACCYTSRLALGSPNCLGVCTRHNWKSARDIRIQNPTYMFWLEFLTTEMNYHCTTWIKYLEIFWFQMSVPEVFLIALTLILKSIDPNKKSFLSI